MIKRREFIAGLGSAAAWPVAGAQQPTMPVIGLLNGSGSISSIPAFRQGLAETGFVEGRNLAVVYRTAKRDLARLPAMATELVSFRWEPDYLIAGRKPRQDRSTSSLRH
jgi:putative ABC transport system substrate-binding protein